MLNSKNCDGVQRSPKGVCTPTGEETSAAVVPVAIGRGVVSVHVARPRSAAIVEVATAPNGTDSIGVNEVGVVRHKTSGTAYRKPAQKSLHI